MQNTVPIRTVERREIDFATVNDHDALGEVQFIKGLGPGLAAEALDELDDHLRRQIKVFFELESETAYVTGSEPVVRGYMLSIGPLDPGYRNVTSLRLAAAEAVAS